MKTSFLSFFCGVLAGMVLYTMPGVPFVIELALFCLGLTVGWVLAEPRHPASLPASSGEQIERRIRALIASCEQDHSWDKCGIREHEDNYPMPKDAREIVPQDCEGGCQ